jgi:hypothetical protein
MISATHRLRLLSEEQQGLRLLLLALQGSIHRAVFAFVAVTGLAVGAYWDTRVIPLNARASVMLVLTQIEFALGVLVIGLFAQHNVATGYAAAVEAKMNKLAEEELLFFEGAVAQRFYRSPRGAFWWAKWVMFVFLLFLFLGVGYLAHNNNCLIAIGLAAELIVLLLLLARTSVEGREARDLSMLPPSTWGA